uniref:Uncharacterized protein n=1 Tax=uncultured marine virus TaxID=186617 RepID=A0A0F7L7U4_9VIRU|nr:hypothetical protein [uncultured marine virus]
MGCTPPCRQKYQRIYPCRLRSKTSPNIQAASFGKPCPIPGLSNQLRFEHGSDTSQTYRVRCRHSRKSCSPFRLLPWQRQGEYRIAPSFAPAYRDQYCRNELKTQ